MHISGLGELFTGFLDIPLVKRPVVREWTVETNSYFIGLVKGVKTPMSSRSTAGNLDVEADSSVKNHIFIGAPLLNDRAQHAARGIWSDLSEYHGG